MTEQGKNPAHKGRWTYSIIVTMMFVLFVAGTTQFDAWYAKPLFNNYLTVGNVGFLTLTALPIALAYLYLRNGLQTSDSEVTKR